MLVSPMTNTILTLFSAELIRRYYAAGHWRDDMIYSRAREHARRAPDRPALGDRSRCAGYGTRVDAVDALAADLDLDHVPLRPSGKIRKRDIAEAIVPGRVAPPSVRLAIGKAARG
jgi:hypothetical protein